MLYSAVCLVAELSLTDQGGALRAPRADASASASALGGPAERASGPAAQLPVIRQAFGTRPVAGAAIFLGAPLSRSRPPRLGSSLRSRRMRSAAPTLDPAATRQG